MVSEWLDLIIQGVQVQLAHGQRAPFVAVLHPDNLAEIKTKRVYMADVAVEVIADFGIPADTVVVLTKAKWDTLYAPQVQ